MKDRLDRLTMSEFIDMAAGDRNVLLKEGESVDEDALIALSSKLYIEYNEIANPSGLEIALIESEDRLTADAKTGFLLICQTLCGMKAFQSVRNLMKIYGKDVSSLSDSQLITKIESLLRELEFIKKRREKEGKDNTAMTPKDIRASYNRELAVLISHYRMMIDVRCISAEVYANLVARAGMELRQSVTKEES